MDKKIDIVIITGFLGAGKTTLLNKLVSCYSEHKIGLLVNDFGKVPIDGSLIKSSSKDLNSNKIYEIGNGSIFCSCLTADFVMGLKYFIEESPDILFIETSGMSDPSSMAKLLNEYKLLDGYRIKHVLCVSDSTNVLKLRKHMTFVDRQIVSSNTILLNKSDLVTDDEQKIILETIKEINSDALIKYTTFCEFDYKSLEFKEFRLDKSTQSCNTKQSAPKKMFLKQIDISKEQLLEFLNSIVEKTMRIKGFYNFENKCCYLSNNNGCMEIRDVSDSDIKTPGITMIVEAEYLDELEGRWTKLSQGLI